MQGEVQPWTAVPHTTRVSPAHPQHSPKQDRAGQAGQSRTAGLASACATTTIPPCMPRTCANTPQTARRPPTSAHTHHMTAPPYIQILTVKSSQANLQVNAATRVLGIYHAAPVIGPTAEPCPSRPTATARPQAHPKRDAPLTTAQESPHAQRTEPDPT